MMHSPLAKMVCKISSAITALNAVNTGLMPMGYDFFKSEFVVMNMSNMINGIHYIVGLAGIISLAALVMCSMKGEHCGPQSCSRCGSMSGCSCR